MDVIGLRNQPRRERATKDQLDVRHELRNPLNAILGYGQLLAMDDLRPEQREAVEEIIAAGNHLLELIEAHFGGNPSGDAR